MISKASIVLSVAALYVACVATAQNVGGVCGAPPVVAANSHPNIFSPEQELWLGQIEQDEFERTLAGVNDPEATRHLQEVVDRLVKNIPSPHVPFRAVMIESSEVNAFSIAGGAIYVNRKLAAVAKSEDELVVVLGHEIGHIASHQFAFETTEEMGRLLHVTSVTDKADILAKYEQLRDAEMKDKHPPKSKEDEHQNEADRVGIYLAAAAGYRVNAFAEWYDRTAALKGKTGNSWTDFAGATTVDQKRLRGIRSMTEDLPKGCGVTGSTEAEAKGFAAWQKHVIENQNSHDPDMNVANIPVIQLKQPLQMEVTRVRFSPDGNYLLAQDESSVYVIRQNPPEVKFRFDALDAQYAWFTPDSTAITFTTPGMHTEKWSIAEQKLTEAHEPKALHDCIQARLSPDGRTSICLSMDWENWWQSLILLDTTSGDVVWQKPKYVQPLWSDATDFENDRRNNIPSETLFMSFSSDGNSLLIGPSSNKVAIDLRTRMPVKIGSGLLNEVTGSYAFLGNDRVAGVHRQDSRASGIFSFPDGKQLVSSSFSLEDLKSVADPGNSAFVLSESIHGLVADKNAKPDKREGYKDVAKVQDRISVVDLSVPKYLWGSRSTALDIWHDRIATEGSDGSISFGVIVAGLVKTTNKIALPPSPLGHLGAVGLSPNGRFLAYSTRDRGGVWDARTGERLALLRPFYDVVWPSDTSMIAEFQKSEKNDREIISFDLSKHQASVLPLKVNSSEKEISGMDYQFYEDWKFGKGKDRQLDVLGFDGTLVFTKDFPEGFPFWTTSYGGRDFIFSYSMKSSTGKSLLTADSKLQAEGNSVQKKEYGRVIEVIDGKSGNLIGRTVLEIPIDYAGTNGLNRAGDNIYITGYDNRTLVYSMTTGKKIWQTFGWVTDLDTETERVIVTNRSDEETILDGGGHELLHTHLGYPIRFAKFQQHATKILMLTSDQSMRTIDIPPTQSTAGKP